MLTIVQGIGISIISLNYYQVNLGRRNIRKKRGAGSTCSSEARVGFADRAVEGGCFPPRVS